MANETGKIALSKEDLRDVTGYAAECAQGVLEIFESIQPADLAWAAHKAARVAETSIQGPPTRS